MAEAKPLTLSTWAQEYRGCSFVLRFKSALGELTTVLWSADQGQGWVVIPAGEARKLGTDSRSSSRTRPPIIRPGRHRDTAFEALEVSCVPKAGRKKRESPLDAWQRGHHYTVWDYRGDWLPLSDPWYRAIREGLEATLSDGVGRAYKVSSNVLRLSPTRKGATAAVLAEVKRAKGPRSGMMLTKRELGSVSSVNDNIRAIRATLLEGR
jgi:hypothetical protein